MSDSVVSHIVMNREGKADGVHYIDRVSKAHREAYEISKGIVIAAATLESLDFLPQLAFSPRFPNGSGSSGVLGHYLMDHFTASSLNGEMIHQIMA